MTLQELTGRESGIVIYPDGDTIVCNWSIICPDDNELPKMFLGGLIGWEVDPLTVVGEYQADDWPDEFRKLSERRPITVLYDAHGDLICPEECPAHFFRLDDATVIIAPVDWN